MQDAEGRDSPHHIDDEARTAAELGVHIVKVNFADPTAGVIYGRNIWKSDHDESLRFAAHLRAILARDPAANEDST